MRSHSLTNFEIQKYYQNELRFNWVYSRDHFPERIKDEAYVMNFHKYADVGTYWIALYLPDNEIVYFDSFRTEHVSKEI